MASSKKTQSSSEKWIADRFERLARFQYGSPWRALLPVIALTAIGIALAMRLTLLTGFENLLPESRRSVQELKHVTERTSGVSTIFVVLEGDDKMALRKAGDALVPEIAKIGPPWVGQVEDGVHDVFKFIEPRVGLFGKLKDLEQLRDDVNARFNYEAAKKGGTLLDDSDPPPDIDANNLRKRFGVNEGVEKKYPDGYYQSEDGKTLVVAIRAGVLASDLAKGQEALSRVKAAVVKVDPKSFHPSIKAGFTGDLPIGIAEYKAINDDLTEVGIAGGVLILSVVFLYYLRIRTLIAMLLTISVGLSWTFGMTQLSLGHLNLATGFLFTIIAGNGINFGLIYMGRYLEELRKGVPLEQALVTAHRETWIPTLTAGAAAAASYASLLVTEFRGFRDFGVIGGAGVLLCWLGTYAALPSILVLMERASPSFAKRKGLWGKILEATQEGIPFGKPFAALASWAPRTVTLVGTTLGVGGAILLGLYIRTNPMEYDLNKVQSDRKITAEEQRLIKVAKVVTGYIGLDGMAILVEKPEQIAPLRVELEKRRDAAPEDKKPFKGVHALQDFVPEDQAAKIPVLLEMKDKILRARKLGAIKDADWATIEPYLPPQDLKPFVMAELPTGLARPFTERDGTRGRMMYISPVSDELTSDALYLFRWADSFRETKLPDGSTIFGSGRAVIYADMWSAILKDVPSAITVSFLATLFIVVVAFRFRAAGLWVLFALLIGISWMGGLLALLGAKLNFLNFIALPITFGIGADYAVNVVARDVSDEDAINAIRRTGGSVVLCSLTTLLGYLALVRSVNFAVRSLGVAAVLGEATCLLAAVLVLPSALVWWRRRFRPAKAAALPSAEPSEGA